MKKYKVTVTYQDAQPEGSSHHIKDYIVEAEGKWSAEIKAMMLCADEFYTYEPVDVVAEELAEVSK